MQPGGVRRIGSALLSMLALALASTAGAQPIVDVGAATGAPGTDRAARVAQAARVCSVCHGAAGVATNHGYFPRIAGKPQGYLYQQLLHFRDGRRHYAAMSQMLQVLDDAYLNEIAGYFAAQALPYPPPQTTGAAADVLALGARLVRQGDPARGVPACVACHGAAMTGVQPFVPGLVGLPRDYLNAQMGSFRNGHRRAAEPDCMARVMQPLTPADVTAISTWLSSQVLPVDTRPAASLPAPMPMACGSVAR
ncbi:c-type cytochrome [Xylophilus sp. Kf1]|nr:c-type cytochrome [Xylophilus sp. Kf1]